MAIKFLMIVAGILLIAGFVWKGREKHEVQKPSYALIAGRDEGTAAGRLVRYPVYRVRVPQGWRRIDTADEESNYDTMRPLCEFIIEEQLHITIHNFPADQIGERVAPEAQVARWKRQLQEAEVSVRPQAHGGYAGLFFEGTGVMKQQQVTVLGLAMQLAPEHFRNLTLEGSPEEQRFFRQMRADYTIKAVGPPILVEKYKKEFLAFARSFELIQAIPTR